MIWAWLTAKSVFNLPRWTIGLLVIAFIVAGVLLYQHNQQVHDTAQQTIGKTEERAAETATILQRTEQGNETRAEAAGCSAGDDAVCYDLCMRYDAGAPATCQRFLPQRPEDRTAR